MLIATKLPINLDLTLQRIKQSKLFLSNQILKVAKILNKKMQWYSKFNYYSLNENDVIYDDEKQYYKTIDRYVTYHVPKINSHQPLIHKKMPR